MHDPNIRQNSKVKPLVVNPQSVSTRISTHEICKAALTALQAAYMQDECIMALGYRQDIATLYAGYRQLGWTVKVW